jgi:hypothetical protein
MSSSDCVDELVPDPQVRREFGGVSEMTIWRWDRDPKMARGDPPAPAPGTQSRSVIEASVGAHSAKPECVLELIETYFPTLPKIELNRRGHARAGWDAWGHEVVAAVAIEAAPSKSHEDDDEG